MLEEGTRLLICHRQLFHDDWPRLAVGIVTSRDGSLVRINGYSWTRDPETGEFTRKAAPRTEIISVAAGTLTVFELPATLDIESVHFDHRHSGRVLLRADGDFELDLSNRPYTS